MDGTLVRKLNLSPEEKQRSGHLVSRLKSVAEFLSDAVDAVKDTNYPAAIAAATPWVGVIGESIAEALPPVKFALKLFEGLTKENDPVVLGHIACSLAYQRAVEQAFKETTPPDNLKKINKEIKQQLSKMGPSEDITFAGFSFKNALEHEFIVRSDQTLIEFSSALGYSEAQVRDLISNVHKRFVPILKTILSHGELRKKFEPFVLLMSLGTGEQQSYDALLEHAEYQRWLFEEAPVFDKEPFALAHVYVDTDCGRLSWGEIRKGAVINCSSRFFRAGFQGRAVRPTLISRYCSPCYSGYWGYVTLM